MTTHVEGEPMTEQEPTAPPSGVPVERSEPASGLTGCAEAQGGAEGRPLVYAIRTAPFGNILYEADSPAACIAKAEASKTGVGYFPECDEIVCRRKPPEPEPWTVVVATTEATS